MGLRRTCVGAKRAALLLLLLKQEQQDDDEEAIDGEDEKNEVRSSAKENAGAKIEDDSPAPAADGCFLARKRSI
jgi:hypothetical protein